MSDLDVSEEYMAQVVIRLNSLSGTKPKSDLSEFPENIESSTIKILLAECGNIKLAFLLLRVEPVFNSLFLMNDNKSVQCMLRKSAIIFAGTIPLLGKPTTRSNLYDCNMWRFALISLLRSE
jgi:hypothetical protein